MSALKTPEELDAQATAAETAATAAAAEIAELEAADRPGNAAKIQALRIVEAASNRAAETARNLAAQLRGGA